MFVLKYYRISPYIIRTTCICKTCYICMLLSVWYLHQWGQSWRSGTKCDCKIDWLWVRSPLEEMKYLLKFYFHFFALVSRLSAALSSASQYAMPPEFGRKWGTHCLNTRFSLPTLLCAGYSVKLIWSWYLCFMLVSYSIVYIRLYE